MIDRRVQTWIGPSLDRIAARLVAMGVGADAMSLVGFASGIGAAALIAFGFYAWALLPMAFSRLCDGLDGAIARGTRPTDRGAFLDITLDFLFYASIPLAFAIANPADHALPAAVLAERRGLSSAAYPRKGLYYLGGLTEGGETLAFFAAMCLWPAAFPWLAGVFAALCAVTVATRLAAGWTLLKDDTA